MAELDDAITMLDSISNDNAVPRNIRKNAQDIIARLKNGAQTMQIKLNTVLSTLDDMSNDPNIPLHARTHLWHIASLLEAVGKKG